MTKSSGSVDGISFNPEPVQWHSITSVLLSQGHSLFNGSLGGFPFIIAFSLPSTIIDIFNIKYTYLKKRENSYNCKISI